MTNISIDRPAHSLQIIGLAITLLCAGFCGTTASVAAAQGGVPTFGSVDVQKVMAGYTKKATADQQMADVTSKLEAQFRQQMASPMLSEANQEELGTLLGKANPTDADKARVTELQAMSQKDSDTLTSLQQVKDPTADQTAQLQQLTKEQQDGQQALQDVGDSLKQQQQAENDKLSAELSSDIKAAIAAVAQQKGLSVVFDSQLAPYTSNDITDDVTKRLNK